MSARRCGALASAALTTALLTGALLGGCQGGHGQHTSQALAESQDRLGALKAGSEYEMAQQQFLAGDLDKALKTIDKCIGYSPSIAKSHVLRGRIQLEQGRLEAAKETFDRALAINPAHAEGLYYSGVALERFSQYDAAHAKYLAAADADSANAQYVIAASEMLIEQSRLEDAATLLESRLALFEHNAGVRQAMGHVASLLGEHDEAVRRYEEARALAPDDLSVLEDLARSQVAAGRFSEAELSLTRLLNSESNKGRRDLTRLRAECLAGHGRHGEARAAFLGLTSDREGASDVASWIGLSRCAMTLGDYSRVRIAANRVLALAPKRVEGHLLLAACMRQQGQLDAALSMTDQAATLAPEDPAVWVFRGVLLRQMGRSDEAAQSLATALRIDPSNARATALLAAVEAQE